MSIVEQLQVIAEKQLDVYNAGYEKGKAEGGGSVENWWQNMIQSRTDWQYVCYKSTIEETPQDLDSSNVINMSNMFSECVNLKTVHKLETSNVTDMSSMFNRCKSLEVIPELDLQNCTSIQTAFINCTLIKTIKLKNTGKLKDVGYAFQSCQVETLEELDLSSVSNFNSTFGGCGYLKNIKIVKNTIKANINFSWSKLLTKESIINIINALSGDTSGLTITLSLTAVKKAFETTKGANDGNTSEEWLNLTATKRDWTITLV